MDSISENDVVRKSQLIVGRLLLRQKYPCKWLSSVTSRRNLANDHRVGDRKIAELERNLTSLSVQEQELSIQAARCFYESHHTYCRPFRGKRSNYVS